MWSSYISSFLVNIYIYIYIIYNLVNTWEININILVLEQSLVANLYKKLIVLSNFNLYDKSEKETEV